MFKTKIMYWFGRSWEIRWVNILVKRELQEGTCFDICFRCEFKGIWSKSAFVFRCEWETHIHRIRLLVICEIQWKISRISDVNLLAVVHRVDLEYTGIYGRDRIGERIEKEFQGRFCWPSKLWCHLVCVVCSPRCPSSWENEFIWCPGSNQGSWCR